jgi:hypothetical protein
MRMLQWANHGLLHLLAQLGGREHAVEHCGIPGVVGVAPQHVGVPECILIQRPAAQANGGAHHGGLTQVESVTTGPNSAAHHHDARFRATNAFYLGLLFPGFPRSAQFRHLRERKNRHPLLPFSDCVRRTHRTNPSKSSIHLDNSTVIETARFI